MAGSVVEPKPKPEAGQIIVVLNWQEQFGDPLGVLNRSVVLTDFVLQCQPSG